MPGISYYAVRGVKFPLWFEIIMAVFVIGAAVALIVIYKKNK